MLGLLKFPSCCHPHQTIKKNRLLRPNSKDIAIGLQAASGQAAQVLALLQRMREGQLQADLRRGRVLSWWVTGNHQLMENLRVPQGDLGIDYGFVNYHQPLRRVS